MTDPVYNRIEGLPRPSIFAASACILLAAVGLWVAELALGWLPVGAEDRMAAENAVYYLPFVVLPVAVCMARRRGLGPAMRLNPLPALPALSVVVLGLLSVYLAAALADVWNELLSLMGLRGAMSVAVPDTPRGLMLSILTMAAVPAVCEELLFRGFAMAAWETRGTWFAIGVTSALFALLHGSVFGLPAYLLVGAISGFLTFALDSLYAGIAYHTVYNAACLVIAYLAARQPEDAAVEMTPAVVFSLALRVLATAALAAMLLVSLRLRARNAGIEPIPRVRRPLAARDRIMLLAAVTAMLATGAIALVIAARMAAENGGGL